jgi:hypothetical protein
MSENIAVEEFAVQLHEFDLMASARYYMNNFWILAA